MTIGTSTRTSKILDRAARAAAEGDAAKAARIRAVHDNYSFSRMEVEENIERLEARMKRERARKAPRCRAGHGGFLG